MDTAKYYEVLYDSEPGWASYTKRCATRKEAEAEKERLEKKGFYVAYIQERDPEALMRMMCDY